MPTIIRYIISLGVGLLVTIIAGTLATTDYLILASLVPLYATSTSMLLAHKQQLLSSSRGSSGLSEKKAGAAIGGFGAFTGALLAQTSILAGFAGYGLLILGMTGGITFFDES